MFTNVLFVYACMWEYFDLSNIRVINTTMTEADALFKLRAAAQEFEANKEFSSAPITSRAYAHYAQAAYNLRHAERVANRSAQTCGEQAATQERAIVKR
jgi:hypothetical protein